jgi:hypothetical protein
LPKYAVKSSITSDREYLPGEVIELSEEQAAAMPWAVGDMVAEPKVEPAPLVVPVKPELKSAKTKP